MMENQAIQSVLVYPLKWRDLSPLTDFERAVFTLAGFCQNELNALRRLSLLSIHFLPNNKDVDFAIMIQRNMLLRTLTAKIFEAIKMYEKVLGHRHCTDKISAALETFKAHLEEIVDHPGYKSAKKIRNKFGNHFDLDAAAKAAASQTDNISCDLMLANESGNGYFPFSEIVTFNLDHNDRANDETQEQYEVKVVDQWIQWTLAASVVIERIHFSLFDKLVLPLLPDRRARKRLLWMPRNLRVSTDTFQLPVFVEPQR